jgi:hypothetical protein
MSLSRLPDELAFRPHPLVILTCTTGKNRLPEQPGAHHRISENASTTEPAKLLAIFVADTNETELTRNDGQ